MFFKKRRRSGSGLTGLLIIAAILYFTGAGAWLWARMQNLEGSCHQMMADMGTTSGSGVCGGIGGMVNAMGRTGETIGSWKHNIAGWFGGESAGLSDAQNSARNWIDNWRYNSPAVASLSSSANRLRELMREGPQSLQFGGSVSDRLRGAMDSFSIGQHYMERNSPGEALPWLQQGATQPGYGILSQLQLGDLYRNGAPGIPANEGMAAGYYSQAQHSLGFLQSSGQPEAQQVLKTLPVSPQALQKQLTDIMAQMTKR